MDADPTRADTHNRADNSADWAKQVVDTVESVIDAVRSKTSEPATKIVVSLAFGLMVLLLVPIVLLLLMLMVIRMLQAYWLHDDIWALYLIVGGLFALVGFLLFRTRNKPTS